MLLRRISGAVIAAALLLATAACGSGATGSDAPEPAKNVSFPAGSTMDTIAKSGKLRVGVKFDHPLLSQRNLKGKLEGFEADMVRYIAAKLGLDESKIELVEASGSNREQFLQQDKVDMVVATLSITDKRQQVISFAGPYLNVKQDLVVKKGNPSGIRNPQDPPGRKVCSTLGGAVSDVTRTTYPQTNLVEFDVSSKCIDALKTGAVDALATQDLIGYSYVAKEPSNLQMLGSPYGDEKWGIGIKKGNTQFCEFLNQTLANFAKDGSLHNAWEHSFAKYGAAEPALPQPVQCS